jgi:predicted nucleic acid-binding protein
MSGATLDAGALIALERGDRRMLALVKRARETRARLAIPAGALGQAWRDGARQALLARLVLSTDVVEVVPLDARAAKEAGQLCGVTGTADVVDASVVLCARARRHAVVTSDVPDLRRLDPDLDLIAV